MNMTTVPSNQLKAMQQEIADLKETIAQQAEAIRLKDAALDWCIGEFNLRLDDIDLSQETIRVLSARHIQPSPEILQARDERVAGECVSVIEEVIASFGKRSLVGVTKTKICLQMVI